MTNLHRQLKAQNIVVPDDFFTKAQRYKTLLMQWNKIHNLTGVKNDAQLDEFIVDAIAPITFLPPITNAMDIGTGAGFPGMMLAFALPDTHFTLVEPLRKRASFLQFIKADLELTNVEIKAVWVEHLPPAPYDLITSRAVTNTQMLLQLSRPFQKEGSLLLFYKGEKVYDEVDPSLDYHIIQHHHRNYLLIKA